MTSDETGNRYTVADIDITRPNVARVYDCFLDGKDNFAADREFVRQAIEAAPKAPMAAKNNRAFLRRVVQYLVSEAGLTQFLDLGSGLPTQGNVSDVAHAIDPTIHVVHVDNDPIVYTHSKALLTDRWTTDIAVGDVRKPAEILADPDVRKLIDFGKPIGLLLFAIIHHVEDVDEPGRIMTELRDAMPPGSYLALSSFRLPGPESPWLRAGAIEGEKLLMGTLGSGRWREDEEILSWFGDWELLEPGLVPIQDWRPLPQAVIERDQYYHGFSGGVARKPLR
jgi:S-adenosyl methyltransferase